ncbi:hypothetical protein MPTK1_4g20070 [Marchantia polymorpha subsp. ruderalis]|uniref:Uncharacterized protein n=2 Tax=Marchantia polymorpha TaxID=3197 RepID=A0AAF6BBU9_MARPO|nr:hypothetical protein MARPO_0116s0009 [Marchantia polymorpha]BBN09483.1 hypothetical protein Mp_4g20070 [Marchantia polymorpha subsp. ruderalis]|eukprot:PTQ31019.1 hypothetical protein MARPO_0116s0009 [Marchantia polymorpha]
MYFELLFASLVVLSTVYMCHMINEGQGKFGYRRFHTTDDYDNYADSTSESEYNAFHLGSPGIHSPRSSRWSSTTFSSDESDREPDQDLNLMDTPTAESHPPASLSLPNGQHPDTVESEITEIEIETLDSPVYQRLGTEPLQPQYAEIPWINNPLFQELAS